MTSIRMKICAAFVATAILGGCGGSADSRRDKFLARGRDLAKKQEYTRAILEFRNALQVKPNDADALYDLGMAYAALEDFRSAVAVLRKALQSNPRHFDAQLRLAQIYAVTNDQAMLSEASAKLRALLEGAPDNVEVLNTLAFTEVKLGHPAEGMQNFEKVLAKAPGALSPTLLLASAKIAQNDFKGAEAVMQRACNDAPNSGEARKMLAEFYLDQKRFQEAEALLVRALELEPKNNDALMDLARLQLTLGRKREAEESFKRLSASFNY